MMMRGVSEQWTHALGAMPSSWLVGLVVVSLWSLAMSLDVLRMFGKRNQLRRAARVVASIPAEVNDNPVAVFDITALGAGFETNLELTAKQELLLDATITTSRGCEDVTLADRRPERAQGLAGCAVRRGRRAGASESSSRNAPRRPSIRWSSTA